MKINAKIEVDLFVKDLHRAELNEYAPSELDAFCKDVRCALISLGVSADDVSDVREQFEKMYFVPKEE